MCTKYNLNDDPEIFKQFIPRNLSKTDMTQSDFDINGRFTWVLTPCIKNGGKFYIPDIKSRDSENRKSRRESFQMVNGENLNITSDMNCSDGISSKEDLSGNLRSKSAHTGTLNRSCTSDNLKLTRKSVRFADDLGLNLSRTKFITRADYHKAPVLSSTAVQHLNLDHNKHLALQGIKYFSCIKGLKSEWEIFRIADATNICLEKAFINGMALFGSIVVKNLSFEKLVGIRISFDNWRSFDDIFGSYILESSCKGFDKFSFSIVIPHNVIVGSQIEFAAFYWNQSGVTFWDNCNGINYSFECFAKIMNIVNETGWMHFL